MTQALFYPWIDIQDDAWLKTALLYWDSVRTIVPESVDAPYSTDTGRALQEAEFLIPLRVQSGMGEIEELVEDVLAYLATAESAELFIAERSGRRYDLHVEKLPYQLGRLADIHSEKLPYEIRHMLRDLTESSNRGGDWLRVDERLANFYMTLLATRLSERVGARLVTSLAAADRLAVRARLDAQLNGAIPWGVHSHGRHRREYEAFGPRHSMPRHLAPGMLANLAIERIGVAPDTPIDRLIEFRERHRDELAQFRTKIEQLATSVEQDLPVEALGQHIMDLYTGEVVPAISNLRAALGGRKIKWLSGGLQQVTFLSASSSTMLVMAGLTGPKALLAGVGISLVATGVIYNADKQESLRNNPFTYLLSIDRELA
ncbi:DUF6236 family protein [Geothrix sp. 21YS21S-4]|uniref:DUF6236 family protein n=1 Tax=Geothrix sp. 21YS21S-4 TaxID=3068889 RepID=UPI0027BAE8F4|nr:DUF6236 family protein [Geothrix sp. 21YS21S-4]